MAGGRPFTVVAWSLLCSKRAHYWPHRVCGTGLRAPRQSQSGIKVHGLLPLRILEVVSPVVRLCWLCVMKDAAAWYV
ncbi:hypothetical protein BD289DRAFT_447935 [Coniella lustricola]|uniref:Uncharacterized protein n=1 Tax=Coniella lustricola TaxID=2025994 RepID=A0A2T2ZSL4_9PEZI|nr:hypothetical protein BD289DRAFT_447935 [Coniella lustricola]